MLIWEIIVMVGGLVLALLMVSGALATVILSGERVRQSPGVKEAAICVQCQGAGWITARDAELRLAGCEGCDGTGVVHR